ncbi:hypothetical protein VTN77DRAFT_5762 [Rasamsonia byssochlamydoides]|uniref:uncharacterized protein n=1 Tax=Rasamsonia byssochlamydoides TaxID=89139 RepID=UPI003742F4E9
MLSDSTMNIGSRARENNDNIEPVYDMNELCSDKSEASRVGLSAYDLLPMSSDYPTDSDGNAIDWDSIMLYGSNFGGKRLLEVGPRKNVMTKMDGDTWKGNKVPSDGDIAQLRRLYS